MQHGLGVSAHCGRNVWPQSVHVHGRQLVAGRGYGAGPEHHGTAHVRGASGGWQRRHADAKTGGSASCVHNHWDPSCRCQAQERGMETGGLHPRTQGGKNGLRSHRQCGCPLARETASTTSAQRGGACCPGGVENTLYGTRCDTQMWGRGATSSGVCVCSVCHRQAGARNRSVCRRSFVFSLRVCSRCQMAAVSLHLARRPPQTWSDNAQDG